MKEYFIRANSFSAPFCSDTSNHYIKAETPREALNKFALEYKHPAGLYSANLYNNADDMHKGKDPIIKFVQEKN